MSKRRVRVLLWVLAGLSAAFVVTVGIVGYQVYSFVNGFMHGTATCLPSDFPRYPGATNVDMTFELGGASSNCHIVLASHDDPSTVTTFYRQNLNKGSLRATPDVDQGDLVNFQGAGGGAPYGTVQIAPGDGATDITVDLYNFTCLPNRFPSYPGAMYAGQSNTVNSGTPCHVVLVTNDEVPTVTRFYQDRLSRDGWQILASGGGKISFQMKPYKQVIASGTVTIGSSGGHTVMTVDSYP